MTKTQKQPTNFKPLFDYIDQRISDSETKILEKLDEKASHLPTKDEFYEKMDEVLGEVKAMREEFSAHEARHEQIDTDIHGLKTNVNHLYRTFEIAQPVAQPTI